nr:DEAD/DEAH box helicase [Cohnella thailandensis]
MTAQGIQKPTPVQEAAIPLVLQGRDVIGQAQTGTGKTLAFVLPMLDRINVKSDKLQGLIVTPTRELALQITNEVKQLIGPEEGIRVLPVYGGQDVEAQLLKLKGNIHLIIATPGRLLDHLRRETVSLFSVQTLVLDEADQMLHMGFLGEVEEILRHTSSQRQTLLFSATMPGTIRELAGRILRKPEEVTVKAKQVTVKDISQLVIETTDRAKQAALVETIKDTRPYLGMIFCRTKRRANTLNEALQQMGFESDELHGDLSQAKREQVMKKFRDAKLQLLVATDVAARGLDVEGVTHVYNYDVPHDVESYIHRIGRTGRAGGSGAAITFVAPKDRPELARIETGIGMKIERQSYGSYVPDEADLGEDGGAARGGRTAGGRSGGRSGGGRTGSGSAAKGKTESGRFAGKGQGGSGRRGTGAGAGAGAGASSFASRSGGSLKSAAPGERPSMGVRKRSGGSGAVVSGETGGEAFSPANGRAGSNRGAGGQANSRYGNDRGARSSSANDRAGNARGPRGAAKDGAAGSGRGARGFEGGRGGKGGGGAPGGRAGRGGANAGGKGGPSGRQSRGNGAGRSPRGRSR